MNRIDNKYISHAIDELAGFLGIKEGIPVDTVLKPLRNGKTKECIEKIANYLGLPITVNLSIGDRFDSRDLVTTNHAGQGIEGITAQVSIPAYLPFYGASALQGFPIQVKVSGSCQRHPEAFVAIAAHELSHIVLHSLWHREKNNEIYTDLAAMLLGFAEVLRIGRNVVETKYNYSSTEIEITTTRFGYLSDEQFEFAFNRINAILKTNITSFNNLREETFQKLTTYKELLDSYRKGLYQLKKFIEYLDKGQGEKIRKEDIPKIIQFHGLDYIERLTTVLRDNEKELKEINNRCSERFDHHHHYTKQRLDSLRAFYDDLNALVSDLTRESALLKDDVAILRRNVGFFYRFKINRQIRSMG